MGSTWTQGGQYDPVEVTALPSVTIRQRQGGGTVVALTLHTKHADKLGALEILEALADQMVLQMERMSQGPLSRADQRRMNHPFGRGAVAPSGRKRAKLGTMHTKGVRGAVPNLTIIHSQSGDLAKSWSKRIIKTSTSVTVELHNSVDYSWWLAKGTRRMQAHGPFTYVPVLFRSRMLAAWQKEIALAKGKANAQAQIFDSFS
jgi:hypothetical protein